jgi:DNA-binding MarR family transcriptional regulator
VLDFMRLIWALDHGLHRVSKRMESSLGVTGPQRLVVRIVNRFPGITPGQIAGLLHVHPSTLTGVLARLQKRGLIRRRVDARDRRRSFVALTAKGRKVNAGRDGTVEAAVAAVMARLPRPTLDRARDVLVALSVELDPGTRTPLRPARSPHGRRLRRSREG